MNTSLDFLHPESPTSANISATSTSACYETPFARLRVKQIRAPGEARDYAGIDGCPSHWKIDNWSGFDPAPI